jgi:four helix bundle protein
MTAIKRFEDITAWQGGRLLVSSVYRASESGPFGRDFALRDQIRKAAISVPSNIAEGFERFAPREFHRFLSIAKGSCGEVRTQLYLAWDLGYLDEGVFGELMKQGQSVSNQIGAFRADLERRHGLS